MKIEKIAIITNYNIPDKLGAAMAVAETLSVRAKTLYVPDTYKERIFRSHNHKPYFTYATFDEIYSNSDLVVVIGGDGVMLEAARRATPCGIPILGINMGRIGYMTELEMTELSLLDKNEYAGFNTGFPDLDKKITGLNRSDLVIVGARPAMGKTSFALNLARNVAVYARPPE